MWQPEKTDLTSARATDMAAEPSIVIVVDDDPGFLKSVARMLSVHGFDVRTFVSAEALLDSDALRTATCMLLDIDLGGISGIELQRRLAASGSQHRSRLFYGTDPAEALRLQRQQAVRI